MNPRRTGPSLGELTTETNSVLAGLGILTVALFPLALPGLLLFVVAPIALVAMVGVLLATPLVLPIWLARIVLRRRSRNRARAVPAGDEIRVRATGATAATS